ncbi:MAG: universal stress protein [Burkholderiales bacterium]|jgi:nucleotide-binding universal stress UspA family protein/hemerythrin-like domain-containing protein|nr:universal stress protein [Burkholderiales bacterium]
MYRHLLVPVDGTELSTETVGQAVEFARTLGARVTFFYAAPAQDTSLRGEAEVVWQTSPNEFVYAFEGRARELLAKAESAARAREVPCGSMSLVSDRPYEAILAAAAKAGCDLIFMASHGRRSTVGMMLGSQTLKVLVHSEVPVLVAATRNPGAAARALGTIRDEHRSLAAVLHAWTHLLAAARRDGTRPDPALLRAIVRYIRDFPLALHHPKENDHLFRLLRQRTSEVDADLDELERQHERDHQMVAELSTMVEAGADSDPAALEAAVARYSTFIWEHMGREEGVILPAAQRWLTEVDWAEIDAAFAANRDPRFGGDTDIQYKRLFSRIVNLAAEAR